MSALRGYDRVLLLSEQPELTRLVDQYIRLLEDLINSVNHDRV